MEGDEGTENEKKLLRKDDGTDEREKLENLF